MAEQLTMIFWRDVYNEPGFLEYSWVPEGNRHTIALSSPQQEGTRIDPGPSDASHVQVYRLTNGRLAIQNWQFPPGPPYKSPVIAAIIQVIEQQMEVVGTVHYADGTSATERRPFK
jgi:hypothetical protein